MRPQRPYLLKAFYDWLLDSQLTPHIIVDANYYGAEVPLEFVRDGQIILNIAPQAVGHFEMNYEAVSFNARFGGVPRQVYVPIGAVLAIYARENGAGTMFQQEEFYNQQNSTSLPELEEKPAKVVMQLVDDGKTSPTDDGDKPTRPRGKPSLRVVK